MNVAPRFVVMTGFLLIGALMVCAQTPQPAPRTTASDTPALVTDRPDFTESSEVVGHRTV